MDKKNQSNRQLISLIIPAYKQEKTIKEDIYNIQKSLNESKYKYEMIVVVDGMLDKTYEQAKSINDSKIKVYKYEENKGKGFAVRFGSTKAKGDIIGFIDAGMDIRAHGISMVLEHFSWYNADIIIGSKLHPVSKVTYPFQRKVLSWGYRLVTRILFGLSIKDTQVGMKFFRKAVLRDILPRLLVKTYAFDIEMLAVAHHLGYTRIYEAPVELEFNGASSITSKSFWKVISLMFWDTLAVFYRLKLIHYYDNSNKKNWKYDPQLHLKVNSI